MGTMIWFYNALLLFYMIDSNVLSAPADRTTVSALSDRSTPVQLPPVYATASQANLLLHCSSGSGGLGDPNAYTKWKIPLNSDKSKMTQSDEFMTLNIASPDLSESGEYTCVITNRQSGHTLTLVQTLIIRPLKEQQLIAKASSLESANQPPEINDYTTALPLEQSTLMKEILETSTTAVNLIMDTVTSIINHITTTLPAEMSGDGDDFIENMNENAGSGELPGMKMPDETPTATVSGKEHKGHQSDAETTGKVHPNLKHKEKGLVNNRPKVVTSQHKQETVELMKKTAPPHRSMTYKVEQTAGSGDSDGSGDLPENDKYDEAPTVTTVADEQKQRGKPSDTKAPMKPKVKINVVPETVKTKEPQRQVDGNKKSVKPGGHTESVKLGDGHKESVKTGVGHKESVKPVDGNKKSVKQGDGSKKSGKPSGHKESVKLVDSNKESVKPDDGLQQSVKSGDEHKASKKPGIGHKVWVKPGVGHKESHKPGDGSMKSGKPSGHKESVKLGSGHKESVKPGDGHSKNVKPSDGHQQSVKPSDDIEERLNKVIQSLTYPPIEDEETTDPSVKSSSIMKADESMTPSLTMLKPKLMQKGSVEGNHDNQISAKKQGSGSNGIKVTGKPIDDIEERLNKVIQSLTYPPMEDEETTDPSVKSSSMIADESVTPSLTMLKHKLMQKGSVEGNHDNQISAKKQGSGSNGIKVTGKPVDDIEERLNKVIQSLTYPPIEDEETFSSSTQTVDSVTPSLIASMKPKHLPKGQVQENDKRKEPAKSVKPTPLTKEPVKPKQDNLLTDKKQGTPNQKADQNEGNLSPDKHQTIKTKHLPKKPVKTLTSAEQVETGKPIKNKHLPREPVKTNEQEDNLKHLSKSVDKLERVISDNEASKTANQKSKQEQHLKKLDKSVDKLGRLINVNKASEKADQKSKQEEDLKKLEKKVAELETETADQKSKEELDLKKLKMNVDKLETETADQKSKEELDLKNLKINVDKLETETADIKSKEEHNLKKLVKNVDKLESETANQESKQEKDVKKLKENVDKLETKTADQKSKEEHNLKKLEQSVDNLEAETANQKSKEEHDLNMLEESVEKLETLINENKGSETAKLKSIQEHDLKKLEKNVDKIETETADQNSKQEHDLKKLEKNVNQLQTESANQKSKQEQDLKKLEKSVDKLETVINENKASETANKKSKQEQDLKKLEKSVDNLETVINENKASETASQKSRQEQDLKQLENSIDNIKTLRNENKASKTEEDGSNAEAIKKVATEMFIDTKKKLAGLMGAVIDKVKTMTTAAPNNNNPEVTTEPSHQQTPKAKTEIEPDIVVSTIISAVKAVTPSMSTVMNAAGSTIKFAVQTVTPSMSTVKNAAASSIKFAVQAVTPSMSTFEKAASTLTSVIIDSFGPEGKLAKQEGTADSDQNHEAKTPSLTKSKLEKDIKKLENSVDNLETVPLEKVDQELEANRQAHEKTPNVKPEIEPDIVVSTIISAVKAVTPSVSTVMNAAASTIKFAVQTVTPSMSTVKNAAASSIKFAVQAVTPSMSTVKNAAASSIKFAVQSVTPSMSTFEKAASTLTSLIIDPNSFEHPKTQAKQEGTPETTTPSLTTRIINQIKTTVSSLTYENGSGDDEDIYITEEPFLKLKPTVDTNNLDKVDSHVDALLKKIDSVHLPYFGQGDKETVHHPEDDVVKDIGIAEGVSTSPGSSETPIGNIKLNKAKQHQKFAGPTKGAQKAKPGNDQASGKKAEIKDKNSKFRQFASTHMMILSIILGCGILIVILSIGCIAFWLHRRTKRENIDEGPFLPTHHDDPMLALESPEVVLDSQNAGNPFSTKEYNPDDYPYGKPDPNTKQLIREGSGIPSLDRYLVEHFGSADEKANYATTHDEKAAYASTSKQGEKAVYPGTKEEKATYASTHNSFAYMSEEPPELHSEDPEDSEQEIVNNGVDSNMIAGQRYGF